jgi:hypothetical protein
LSSRWAAGTSAVVDIGIAVVDIGIAAVVDIGIAVGDIGVAVVELAFAALDIVVELGNCCSIGCCWVHSEGPKEGCWVIVPSCRAKKYG